MADKEQIPRFNLGDTVILSPAYGNQTIERIVKVTKTRAYISDLYYFNRFTGTQPGSSPWRRAYIHSATDEWIAKIQAYDKRTSLMSRIGKINWTSFSTDQLERVIAVIDDVQSEKGRTQDEQPRING